MKTRKTTWTWKQGLGLLACIVTLASVAAVARADEGASCGENNAVCGQDEKCCQHPVATFCDNNGCSSVYAEGQCVPQGQSCNEFWCGNRRCKSNFFMANDVCCVYNKDGEPPQYSCASSELSCPGNSQQLTIRETADAKTYGD